MVLNRSGSIQEEEQRAWSCLTTILGLVVGVVTGKAMKQPPDLIEYEPAQDLRSDCSEGPHEESIRIGGRFVIPSTGLGRMLGDRSTSSIGPESD